MKAYVVGLTSNDDNGQEIVFANTSKEAVKKAMCMDITDLMESYIDVYARRSPAFDGMESASGADIMLKKFREGWTWYDLSGQPYEEETTDEEFFQWLEKGLA